MCASLLHARLPSLHMQHDPPDHTGASDPAAEQSGGSGMPEQDASPPREGRHAHALAAVGVQVARDELHEELLRRVRVRAGRLAAGRHDLVERRKAGRAILRARGQPKP